MKTIEMICDLGSIALVGILALGCCNTALAHETNVHEKITIHAAATAYSSSAGYRAFLDRFAPVDQKITFDGNLPHNPAGWMAVGSAAEDDNRVPMDLGGIRSYNHFYDPLSGKGLSNFPTDDEVGPMGRDSFTWAMQKDVAGIDFRSVLPRVSNVGTRNEWTWQGARDLELDGLEKRFNSERKAALAKMFRSLGDVLHLLQDTTSPQHSRNEQHLDTPKNSPWRSPFEKYGFEHAGSLQYTHAMLDWKSAGFQRVRDFWDRDLALWNRNNPQVHNAQPLIDSEDPTKPDKKLGLAEFVNGNFIGERHSYREVTTAAASSYPFPSLDEGTNWKNLLADPRSQKVPTTIVSIGDGFRYVVKKDKRQGREVTHHGAVNYLTAVYSDLQAGGYPLGLQSSTLDDLDILKDYHDVLIPEAVKYCAALIDYYFRGRLEVTAAPSTAAGDVALTIRNVSGMKFHGGSFRLFYDDDSGAREIRSFSKSDYDPSAGLEDGHNATAEFTPPSTPPVRYTLIFQGDIGMKPSSTEALDSMDAGRAIAVAGVNIPRITTESLPATVCDTAYSQAIEAEGGVPPYTFAVSAGTLPNGLNLAGDGTISGTISGSDCDGNSHNYTIAVTDSVGNSTAREMTLSVGAGNCPNWATLQWTAPSVLISVPGYGTASGSASGNSAQAASTSTAGCVDTAGMVGSLSYTGQGCDATLTINVTDLQTTVNGQYHTTLAGGVIVKQGTTTLAEVYVDVWQSDNSFANDANGHHNLSGVFPGSFTASFHIQPGVNSPITIRGSAGGPGMWVYNCPAGPTQSVLNLSIIVGP